MKWIGTILGNRLLEWKSIDGFHSCRLREVKVVGPGTRRATRLFFHEGSLEEFTRLDSSFPAFPWKGEKEWVEIFRAANLDIVRSETRTDIMTYESPRAALRQIFHIGAISENRRKPDVLKRLPEDLEKWEKGYFELSWRTMRAEYLPFNQYL